MIIPVYNGERFLAEAIESVFAQDHRPTELIVVDDASTDGSAELAGSFDDIVLLRRSENGGPSIARNEGLALASGELVTFLDADDQMTPGRLATQVERLQARSELGCVLMGQELLLDGAAAVPSWLRPIGAPDDIAAALMISAMVRREVFDLVGGFDPTYRLCEDVDWLFRVRDAGVWIEILPQVGVIRRIHADNATHQIEAVRAAMGRAVRARLERSRVAPRGDPA